MLLAQDKLRNLLLLLMGEMLLRFDFLVTGSFFSLRPSFEGLPIFMVQSFLLPFKGIIILPCDRRIFHSFLFSERVFPLMKGSFVHPFWGIFHLSHWRKDLSPFLSAEGYFFHPFGGIVRSGQLFACALLIGLSTLQFRRGIDRSEKSERDQSIHQLFVALVGLLSPFRGINLSEADHSVRQLHSLVDLRSPLKLFEARSASSAARMTSIALDRFAAGMITDLLGSICQSSAHPFGWTGFSINLSQLSTSFNFVRPMGWVGLPINFFQLCPCAGTHLMGRFY
ncbi:uncharacterized protein G2W53_014098 [Senna tora]|uniref:Uncharacterized protein n=1 Tax=Senna tora TaxID=362788 RepID=A0A834U060_9FABA|nr:uncharacterized protein G2W53_014098 [Senna tora]